MVDALPKDIPQGPTHGNGIGDNRAGAPIAKTSITLTSDDVIYFGKENAEGDIVPSAGTINRLCLQRIKVLADPPYAISGTAYRCHRDTKANDYPEPNVTYTFALQHDDIVSLFQKYPGKSMQTLTLHDILDFVVFFDALQKV